MSELFVPTSDIIIPTGACALILRDGKTGKIKAVDFVKNMIVTVGKNSMASALKGTTDNNQGIITYCGVGTSAVAPALSDTALTTEIFRKLVSVRSVSGNVATFQTFFTTTEGNGTLREAGLFGDAATDGINTGTLFSKLAINRTKSASDTLTMSWDITIG